MAKLNLSTPQQNIWNLQSFYGDSAISNICGSVFLNIPLKEPLLGDVMNNLIKNHNALRMTIKNKNNPEVIYHKHTNIIFEELDYSNKTNKEINKILQKRSEEAIELQGNLCEFVIIKRSEDWGLYIKISHLIADAWSMSLIIQNIVNNYVKLLKNESYDPTISDYTNFIHSEIEYRKSSRYQKDKDFFDNVFKTEPKFLTFGNNKNKIIAKRKQYILTKKETLLIKNYCQKNNMSPAILFETAMAIYMQRFFNESQIIMGMPVINRSNFTEKQTIGMFISTMPLVINIDSSTTVKTLMESIINNHFNLFKHQRFPLTDISNLLKEKHNYQGRLYDVTISYQDAQTNINQEYITESNWYFNGYSENGLVIHISDMFNSDRLHLDFDYIKTIFQPIDIQYLKRRLLTIINQIVVDHNQLIKDIILMDDKEYRLITEVFNNTNKEYDNNLTVVDLFNKAVKKDPNKIALVFEDLEYTYQEVDQITNQIATSLQSLKLNKNSIIALITERSQYTVFGMLGIIKAGYAYLPIDINTPVSRLQLLLKKLDITTSINYNYQLPNFDIKQINIDNLPTLSNYKPTCINPNDACCILHTSGSTGEPKAVKILHRNLVNIFINYFDYLQGSNCVISNINVSFDPFILETLYPLVNNIKCIMTNYEEANSINKFIKILNKYKQATIFSVPSKFMNILNESEDLSFIKNINNIIIGGESLNKKLIHQLRKNNKNINVYNSYGPNETTIFCTTSLIKNDINIGKPIANYKLFLCDSNNQLLPIGFFGEILVSGVGVSAGYINEEEKNKKSFITTKYGLAYKTGDIAKLSFSGNYYFQYRNDNQIKIRGQRIELGDIENNALKIMGVLEAKVEVYEISGQKQIRLYFTTNSNLTPEKLRISLSKKIPRYMMPSEIHEIEKFVITERGKYDFSKLKIKKNNQSETELKKPTTNLEKKLLSIFKKVLNNKLINIESDFFESGGDSLQAIALMDQIEKELQINLPVKDIFNQSSVVSLAAFLSQKSSKKSYIDNLLPSKIKINNTKHRGQDILLTGATGYVGIHILKYLLENTNFKINMIIRSEARLIKLFKFYFNQDISKYQNRIKIFVANITSEKLGLTEKEYQTIKNNSNCIVNCAANVKHYGKMANFKDINVTLVSNLLELAASNDMVYNQLSTISVSGLGLCRQTKQNTIFNEWSLDIGQIIEDNVYIQTKYMAELLTKQYEQAGLKVNIFRLGNIVERLSDQKFQINAASNGFQTRVEAIKKIGVITDEIFNMPVDLSYVDKVAEAIIKILLMKQYGTYHLYNFNETRFGDYLLNKGISFKIVDKNNFQNIIKINNDPTVAVLKLYLNDFSKNKYDNIKVDSNYTIEILKKINFDWRVYEK